MPLESSLEVTQEAERITFKYTVTNTGDDPITLRFRGGHDAEIAVLQNGREVWNSSSGPIGLPVIRQETVDPGESKTYARHWNNPSPGTYTAEATLTSLLQPAPAETTFSVGETSTPPLQGRLSTSRSHAGIRFDFVVRNTGDEAVILNFPSYERAAYIVYDETGEIWRGVYEVPHILHDSKELQRSSISPGPGRGSTKELPAGESISYALTWPDPEPGTYTVIAHLLARNASPEAANGFTVQSDAPYALDGSLSAERSGGNVQFTYAVENTTNEPVEVTFPTANEADVAAVQDGEERWRWSRERTFPQVIETRTFGPGESVSYEREWSEPVGEEFTAVGTLQARNATAGATTTVPAEC